MRAFQVTEPGTIQPIEKEMPAIQRADEVLIQVKRVGICGSDLHIIHGSNPMAVYPRVIGHEVAGVVEAVGSGVTEVCLGDRVVLEPICSCGECYACRIGRANVCEKLQVYGVHRDGGCQEYMVLPVRNLHRLTDHVDISEAALVEPFTIGAQANWRGGVQKGDVVFIIGAGPTGLCCLNIAKAKGAICIISDLSEERLAFARQWGADHTIHAASVDVCAEVLRLTQQMGANIVIDAVGSPTLVEDAVHVASVAGRVVTLGFSEQPSQLTQVDMTKKELTIAGSRLQTDQFPQVVQWFNDGTIQPGEMISHHFPMEEIQSAVRLIENEPNRVRKVLLHVNE
ncbi:zinc-binding alcohol dehydrogenase family protein [Melghirimyces thermohalophilus]|nr:zinc-binding alcohol dehydrogenase family protein [Melghirimyces thermohalophilus]